MLISPWITVVAMLFVPAGDQKENPWRDKVAPAVERAQRAGTTAALREALEVTWRADDWQAGLQLARDAIEKLPKAPELRAPIARTLWRAGLLAEADRIAAGLSPESDDRVALGVLITPHLARGERKPAADAARRLESLGRLSGEDLYYVIGARWTLNQLDGIGRLIRRAEKLTDPDNGYPEIYVAEQLEGLAEFFDAVGTDPLNQLVRGGSAPMPAIPVINLPGCEAMINGHGPYRLILDTGGSIMLSLDEEVAAEIGLESIAPASIHGVAGKTEANQVLVDELSIGRIKCRRVRTRTCAVRKAIALAADGILGTGVFSESRMTLDFLTGRLIVEPSSEHPGRGAEVELRVVSDAKLIALITLQREPAAALLDTGADVFAIAPSRLKRIFPGKKIRSLPISPMMGVGEGQNPTLSLTPGVEFEFAGRRHDNYGGLGLDVLDTLLGPILGVQTDVLVGMPVFRQMKTLTVDFPRCKMWVNWLEPE